MVGDALRAVLAKKQPVALQKIQEQSGGDSLVAVGEAVVFRDEIEQVRRLLLRRWIEVLSAKRLIDRPKRGLERTVFLIAESIISPVIRLTSSSFISASSLRLCVSAGNKTHPTDTSSQYSGSHQAPRRRG